MANGRPVPWSTGGSRSSRRRRRVCRQLNYAVHSTTIVTNAIVERRGVKTALLTTRGFRDVLEIGIEQIYDIYDLFAPYPEPLIPRELRCEVDERVTRDGDVVEPLDEDGVRTLVDELASEGVKSIAVSLMHAYRNPDHERRIGRNHRCRRIPRSPYRSHHEWRR